MTEDWLIALRTACEQKTQSAVAKRLGVSAAQVSLVLKSAYDGDINRIKSLVEGILMGRKLVCPIMDVITTAKCREIQETYTSPGGPWLFDMMHKACRSGCPHSRLEKDYDILTEAQIEPVKGANHD